MRAPAPKRFVQPVVLTRAQREAENLRAMEIAFQPGTQSAPRPLGLFQRVINLFSRPEPKRASSEVYAREVAWRPLLNTSMAMRNLGATRRPGDGPSGDQGPKAV